MMADRSPRGAARAVLERLQQDGALSPTELRAQLGLPERTLRHALRRLEEDGLVAWSQDLRDTRVRRYSVRDPASRGPPDA